MMKPTYTIAIAAIFMVAAFVGVALVDDEADAEAGNVSFQVGSITYTATTDDNGAIVLLTPGQGILENESAQYFQGWRESTVEDGPVYSAGSTQSDAIGKTFVAVYIEYGVSFFENTAQTADAPVKGEALELKADYDASATPGGTIVLPDKEDFTSAPTAESGLQFVGWSINGVVYEPGAEYTVAADAEAIAVYNNGFKVTFTNNNSTITTITILGDLTADKMPTPAMTGYTFMGWDTNADGKVEISTAQIGAEDFKYTVTADTTLDAVFEPINMTIALMVGETAYGTVTAPYNTIAIEPTLPAGYIYWATKEVKPVLNEDGTPVLNEDGTPKTEDVYTEFDFTRPITANVTLYAVAADVPVPDESIYATFNIEGTIYGPYKVTDRFSIPQTDREGYNFLGWTVQGGDGTKLTSAQVQNYEYTEDVTFVAVYEVAEPPAPEEPAFYETSMGQIAIVIVIFAILAFGYGVYSNAFGLKDKLFGYTIQKKEKKE